MWFPGKILRYSRTFFKNSLGISRKPGVQKTLARAVASSTSMAARAWQGLVGQRHGYQKKQSAIYLHVAKVLENGKVGGGADGSIPQTFGKVSESEQMRQKSRKSAEHWKAPKKITDFGRSFRIFWPDLRSWARFLKFPKITIRNFQKFLFAGFPDFPNFDPPPKKRRF